MGQKVTEQVAEMRSLPAGIDQRSPARHPTGSGPDDLSLKIQEIREATDYQVPIQLKLGAARVYDDVRMAAKCGPDIIYLDGARAAPGAGPHLATEETGIPLMAAIPEARRALEDVGLADEIDLVVAGGIRNGGDIAKCIALGAKAVAIGHSALMALNCNKEIPGVTDYMGSMGVPAGECYHCHTGRCPVGITTQDPSCASASSSTRPPSASTTSCTRSRSRCRCSRARAARRTSTRSSPRTSAALTVEAAAMAKVPLTGTDYIRALPRSGRWPGLERLLERHLENPIDSLRRRRQRRRRERRAGRRMSAEPEKITSIDASTVGRTLPYQEDISLVEDVDLLAATPGTTSTGSRTSRSGARTASRPCSTATRTRS
jgi:hypothetical protein